MEKIRKHLLKKGWKKRDIDKAIKLISHAKKHKHPKIKLLDKAVYWISLAVAVAGNFIIAVALVPFLLALSGLRLFLFVIILSLSFGLLFELLVRGIENLEAKHHILLGVAIPLIAAMNFVLVSNNLRKLIGIDIPHNPVIIGAIYSIAFILPYIYYNVFVKGR